MFILICSTNLYFLFCTIHVPCLSQQACHPFFENIRGPGLHVTIGVEDASLHLILHTFLWFVSVSVKLRVRAMSEKLREYAIWYEWAESWWEMWKARNEGGVWGARRGRAGRAGRAGRVIKGNWAWVAYSLDLPLFSHSGESIISFTQVISLRHCTAHGMLCLLYWHNL